MSAEYQDITKKRLPGSRTWAGKEILVGFSNLRFSRNREGS